MLDQILDNYRKAAETTIQLQQDMLRRWTQYWPGMPDGPDAQLADAPKKWAEALTGMMDKHRETLDAQYRAGIKTIEDAFRVGEAKDPEQFRKLFEELWRQSIQSLTTVVEAQMNDVQSVMQKWFEVASQGATAGSKE